MSVYTNNSKLLKHSFMPNKTKMIIPLPSNLTANSKNISHFNKNFN